MALVEYIVQTQRLLNDILSVEYTSADLLVYINLARAQLAADAECLRQPATVGLATGQRQVSYASAVFVAAPTVPAGLAGILSIKSIGRVFGTAGGVIPLYNVAWEWLNFYYIQRPLPITGAPTRWATLQPGLTGTFWVDTIPDAPYTLSLDAVCAPTILDATHDTEAIPYPWTDAVPFYAAYLAYLNSQRPADAERMLGFYKMFAKRGTQMTTSTQLPGNYPGGAGAASAGAKALLTGEVRGAR